jgi:geranylgeranyl pyrophosphate synthase
MLDLLGTPEFGKQRGQDLREGKKTFPILAAYSAVTSDSDRTLLETYLSSSGVSSQNDIDQIADLCRRLDIPSVAQATIDRYIDQAQTTLVTVLPPSEARAQLLAIADQTRTRQL